MSANDAVETPNITQLCRFPQQEAIASALARTAEYAEDPRAYLVKTIGEEAVNARADMLCIPDAPLQGDFYGMGPSKAAFETHMAQVVGKEHGLFFITGIQAQLTTIKSYCERAQKNMAAWHVTCHLELVEHRAYKELYGLDRLLLGSHPDVLPTVDEIQHVLQLPEAERPAVILLEIPNRTCACETYTWDQLQQISAACKQASVALHMDGARLWEIEPWYRATAGTSFAQLGALFDSVYVSMYKGLGAATGAFLLSNDGRLMDELRVWQRRAGGNAYSSSYYWIDCQRAFNQHMGTFDMGRNKLIAIANKVTEATAAYKAQDGAPVIQFRPAVPTCSYAHVLFHGYTNAELQAAQHRVEKETHIQVYGWIRPVLSLERRRKRLAMMAAPDFPMTDSTGNEPLATDVTHWTECSIHSATEATDVSVYVKGYVELCKALFEASK
ncbi:hypothetical protein ACEQ8H_005400 [Pleosporales sp. CAS-2024a]